MTLVRSSRGIDPFLAAIMGIILVGIGTGLLSIWYTHPNQLSPSDPGTFIIGFITGSVIAMGLTLILWSARRR